MGQKFIIFFIFFLFQICATIQSESVSQTEKKVNPTKEQEWPPIVSLPVYPPLSNLEIQNPPPKKTQSLKAIKWKISKHSGTQFITRKENSSWFSTIKNGTSFPVNNYKSILVTVQVKDYFFLNSNLTVGFVQGTTPLSFSQYTLPYEYSKSSSISSEFYVSKEIQTLKSSVIYPFVGHTFSRYLFEIPFTDQEKKFQAFVIGISQNYSPSRLISVSQGVLFSPVITQSYDNLLLFQFGYETEIKFNAGPLTLSVMGKFRDNFQYTQNLNPSEEISVSEIGFKFSFIL